MDFVLAGSKFRASYLTDISSELSKIETLSDDGNPLKIFIDGEENMLCLTMWRTFDEKIIVVWEEYAGDKDVLVKTFIFAFEDFIKSLQENKEKTKYEYAEHFTFF